MNQKLFRNTIIVLIIILAGTVGFFVLSQKSLNGKSLIGKWNVTSVEREGTQLVDGSNATIEFFIFGIYKVSDGCNKISPSFYRLSSNGGLTFRGFGTTLMACAGNFVPIGDLVHVYSYQLTNNDLVLFYRTTDGTEGVFRLQKI